MKLNAHLLVQRFLGLLLIGFSLTPLFGWEPPPVELRAQPMRDAIVGSGYILPVILIVYALVGAAWLADRFVPLAALALFPISLNILLFHLLLNRAPFGQIVAVLLFAANVYMLIRNISAYRELLKARP